MLQKSHPDIGHTLYPTVEHIDRKDRKYVIHSHPDMAIYTRRHVDSFGILHPRVLCLNDGSTHVDQNLKAHLRCAHVFFFFPPAERWCKGPCEVKAAMRQF